MAKIRKCGNCGKEMEFLGEEQIQLGQVGVVLVHLSNLLGGSLDVELWECYNCGKIDFYRQGSTELGDGEDRMPQVICCKCGTKHDLGDPKCPGCGLKNPNYS